MAKYKLNAKSAFFYDQALGIKILPSREVEVLDSALSRSKRFRAAVNSGHIIKVGSGQDTNSKVLSAEEKDAIFMEMVAAGKLPSYISNKFSLDALKEICEIHEIVPEESDTKMTLTEAILADITKGPEQE